MRQQKTGRSKLQGQKKRPVGKEHQATRTDKATDWHPIPMGNKSKGRVGNPDWWPSPRGDQGKRKEDKPDWQITLTGNSRLRSAEQQKGQP